jgi:signal transduction histidine kinase
MRERVELSGGTFTLISAPGEGLRFTVRIPAIGKDTG